MGGADPFPAGQWGQEKSGTDAVMHARQTSIQLVRQTEGQEKSGTDVVMQADRHAFSRRGKQRDRKSQEQMW